VFIVLAVSVKVIIFEIVAFNTIMKFTRRCYYKQSCPKESYYVRPFFLVLKFHLDEHIFKFKSMLMLVGQQEEWPQWEKMEKSVPCI